MPYNSDEPSPADSKRCYCGMLLITRPRLAAASSGHRAPFATGSLCCTASTQSEASDGCNFFGTSANCMMAGRARFVQWRATSVRADKGVKTLLVRRRRASGWTMWSPVILPAFGGSNWAGELFWGPGILAGAGRTRRPPRRRGGLIFSPAARSRALSRLCSFWLRS